MIQHEQITFGQSKATTLELLGTEQFSNQIGISETPQHDIAVVYAPTDTDPGIALKMYVYVSFDGMAVDAADSQWFPFCADEDDGNGVAFPVQRVYGQAADGSSPMNPARSFAVGAKKIRFGFLEDGTPDTPGVIDAAYLSSRSL
jgi:hypothetical protein